MIYVFGILLSLVVAQAETPCACPKLACDPCSVEKGVSFYSEKCGAENERVRSCAKPTCVPIETATNECPVPPSAKAGNTAPVVVKAATEESAASEAVKSAAGKVKVIQGSVSIVHADGKKIVVQKDGEVNETDRIESGKDSAALVTFTGGNKVHVHSETALEIKEYKDPENEASRKALLLLIKGKIRNQVAQKYNGKTTYYKIQTKEAVAGVRGTDFVVEQYNDGKEVTRVETLHGSVHFTSLDERESVDLERGEGAKYSDTSISPKYKLRDDQILDLDRSSRVDAGVKREARAEESAICDHPKAMFNQCVWRCGGNKKGETKCRIDQPGVTCTRQRCNGNGQWSEDTHIPDAAAPILCPPTGTLVKDCDY